MIKKKMIRAINDHGQSFWLKQTQLVVYKLDTICKGIRRESISLFSIGRLSNCLSSNGIKFQIFGS